MSAFLAVMWNGFREARRHRVTTVALGFALVLLFSTNLVTQVTVWTFDRTVTDFGLGLMSLLLTGIAMYLACGLLPREIERRTIFLIVTRPLSRTRFLFARLAGNLVTLAALELMMTAVFLLQLKLYVAPVTQPILASLLGLFVELIVISAAGVFFSAFSGQVVAVLCTIGLYWAGHFSREIYLLAEKAGPGATRQFARAVFFAVPNLERVNFRSMATYQIDVPFETLSGGIVYCLAFAAAFAAAAAIIFERRDFR